MARNVLAVACVVGCVTSGMQDARAVAQPDLADASFDLSGTEATCGIGILPRGVWLPYGASQAGCNAACQDLCGIPTGSIQTWLMCVCGY